MITRRFQSVQPVLVWAIRCHLRRHLAIETFIPCRPRASRFRTVRGQPVDTRQRRRSLRPECAPPTTRPLRSQEPGRRSSTSPTAPAPWPRGRPTFTGGRSSGAAATTPPCASGVLLRTFPQPDVRCVPGPTAQENRPKTSDAGHKGSSGGVVTARGESRSTAPMAVCGQCHADLPGRRTFLPQLRDRHGVGPRNGSGTGRLHDPAHARPRWCSCRHTSHVRRPSTDWSRSRYGVAASETSGRGVSFAGRRQRSPACPPTPTLSPWTRRGGPRPVTRTSSPSTSTGGRSVTSSRPKGHCHR